MSALKAVLRVRSLLEKRALAEQVAAERVALEARAAVAAARTERAGHRPTTGTASAAAITAGRVGALALHERVLGAGQRAHVAEREAELAGNRRVAAAIGRRSVERLDERRNAQAAATAAKRVERQLDDLAIDRWRRS